MRVIVLRHFDLSLSVCTAACARAGSLGQIGLERVGIHFAGLRCRMRGVMRQRESRMRPTVRRSQ